MSFSIELLNDIKEECICPLTGIYMATPIVTNTGFVCEMDSIKELNDPKTGKKICPRTNLIVKSWQHCKKTRAIVSLLLKHNVIQKKELFKSKYELEKLKKIFADPKLAKGKTIKQILEKINLQFTNVYDYLKRYYLFLNFRLKTFDRINQFDQFDKFKTFFEEALNESDSNLSELYKFMHLLLQNVGSGKHKNSTENKFSYEIVNLLLNRGVIYNNIDPNYTCELAVLTDFSYIEDNDIEKIMFDIFDDNSKKFNQDKNNNLSQKIFERCNIDSLTRIFVYSSFKVKQKMLFQMLCFAVKLKHDFEIFKFFVNVLKYDHDMESNVFDENLVHFCENNREILGIFTNGYYDNISTEIPNGKTLENISSSKRTNENKYDDNEQNLKQIKLM